MQQDLITTVMTLLETVTRASLKNILDFLQALSPSILPPCPPCGRSEPTENHLRMACLLGYKAFSATAFSTENKMLSMKDPLK